MAGISIRAADMPRDLPAVQSLCWAYRDYLLNFNPNMRKLASVFYPEDAYRTLMADLPVKHARPKGIIFLAERDSVPVGCGMSHPLNGSDTEIKRVFVTDAARGSGAGKMVSQALIDQARADGYARILLDTNKEFEGARKLYEKLGFVERGPYSELPPGTEASLVFYEFIL
ncbi:GNAT family N-acetyltransferase [uncultured Roseobacter sp.]|uniref:GNAT family N-acetyltransferase n=1 Tax=uncultured Roseobacter sp. TaxID=114847 RepID=UPI00260401B3|nr:GNAT family N-acetyltransferase [uncultured Roseobacter sp.]